MSRFRKVDGGTWGDKRFASLSQDAKLLWLYLLTGPQVTSLPGVLVLGKATLSEALEWSTRRVNNALEELSRTNDSGVVPMIKTDWKSRLVWLPNAFRHNKPANPSVVRGWRDHWRCTPECDLKLEIEVELRARIASMVSEGINEYLMEFDELTGKSPARSRPPSEPKQVPPSPAPSSTPSLSPSLPPSSSPSLARTRTDTAPVTSPALSGDERGSADVKADDATFHVGTARCEEACHRFVTALAQRDVRRPPVRDRWDRQDLCDAINTFIGHLGSTSEILTELSDRVVAWATEMVGDPGRTNGWSPKSFSKWLATRPKPASATRLSTRDPEASIFSEPFRDEWADGSTPIAASDSEAAPINNVAKSVTPIEDIQELSDDEWERRRQAALASLQGTT